MGIELLGTIPMNLVMRRNPTTFDLGHVTSRDVLLTIDGTEWSTRRVIRIWRIYGVSNPLIWFLLDLSMYISSLETIQPLWPYHSPERPLVYHSILRLKVFSPYTIDSVSYLLCHECWPAQIG